MNLTTYITGGLAVVLAAVYFLYQVEAKKVERRDALIAAHQSVEKIAAKEIAEAKAVNDENVRSVTELMQDLARQRELTAKAERAARERDLSLKQALKRIANAPTTDDGPVAPVLRTELDSLRAPAVDGRTGGTDSSDQGATGVEPTPSGPDVPPAPPAS